MWHRAIHQLYATPVYSRSISRVRSKGVGALFVTYPAPRHVIRDVETMLRNLALRSQLPRRSAT